MENPWNIESIYELQYFNCPNCVYKNHSKQLFVDHAFFYHPQSISSLTNLKDDSLDDVVIDIPDVKTKTNLMESVSIKIEPELIEPIVEIDEIETEHEEFNGVSFACKGHLRSLLLTFFHTSVDIHCGLRRVHPEEGCCGIV